jgi:predicted nucleic acid-binding protein
VRLLIDINVLLDVVLEREPWAASAAQLLSAIETNRAHGYVAGHTITTVHYVVSHGRNRKAAAAAVSDLLRIVDVVPIAKEDLQHAVGLSMSDFEDAVQVAAALKISADYIVTRNEKDFRSSSIPPADPPTVLTLI